MQQQVRSIPPSTSIISAGADLLRNRRNELGIRLRKTSPFNDGRKKKKLKNADNNEQFNILPRYKICRLVEGSPHPEERILADVGAFAPL